MLLAIVPCLPAWPQSLAALVSCLVLGVQSLVPIQWNAQKNGAGEEASLVPCNTSRPTRNGPPIRGGKRSGKDVPDAWLKGIRREDGRGAE